MSPIEPSESSASSEPSERDSRAQFLRKGAAGGLALVAGGSVLALAACGDDEAATGGGGGGETTPAPADMGGAPTGDGAIASLAATAELLAIDFYTMAIDTGFFEADVLAYMEAARQNEQDHYDALVGVLGDQAPADLTFTYPDGTFDTPESIASTGSALETAFVGAYMGAVTSLSDNMLKQVAGQIGANEAQHLNSLNLIGNGGELVPNPAFPGVLTAQQATEAVTPFLG